ncbi:Lipoate--protein ligase [Purpureocillium takamizusanense]|uniref:Putative lipoate-protein ligase A n=1 Tax=Purpureocillium takamizusanense TaxID=2060973 RepID=A0A9Q8QNY2_9HYPO|nr:Lipoate--protein ligase [Purpureocillium takamizusanense]UNI24714.1 Lipoate--protein ligase [Purpureocillium takamizusanense]
MPCLARHGRPIARSLSSLIPASCTTFGFIRRGFSTDAASHPSNKTQVYISKSRDPLLNLSAEHHLLQITPAESTVLILYVNSPCVVFGRNQNPWLETNLPRLAQIVTEPGTLGWTDGPVQLIRRRSGGGTVFHDAGNVNFSVICPPAAFDRDKHARMVVRALKSLGRPMTRVNERHDIVMDVDSTDSQTIATTSSGTTFKVSGSAYKLTRLRSLHHGTCLLRSPNLSGISGMLRSPAEPFIKARGVDSVRSPVRNLDLDNADFEDAVVEQFRQMYGDFDVRADFGSDALAVGKISAGYEELGSRSWTYSQTPRFTFCTHPFQDDPRVRPELPFDLKIHFEARHGLIEQFSIEGNESADTASLVKSSLHDIGDWTEPLTQAGLSQSDAADVGSWLNGVLGTLFTRP